MEVVVESTYASNFGASVFNNRDVAIPAELNFLNVNDVSARRAQMDSCGSGQPLIEQDPNQAAATGRTSSTGFCAANSKA